MMHVVTYEYNVSNMAFGSWCYNQWRVNELIVQWIHDQK